MSEWIPQSDWKRFEKKLDRERGGFLADDYLVFFDESLESELSEVHPIKSRLYSWIKQTIRSVISKSFSVFRVFRCWKIISKKVREVRGVFVKFAKFADPHRAKEGGGRWEEGCRLGLSFSFGGLGKYMYFCNDKKWWIWHAKTRIKALGFRV